MPDPSLLSVREAAEHLGISPAAVRQQIAAGRLPAVKRGRSWWLDQRAVGRLARQRPGSGLPLSPAMAWAVLLLASGDEIAAEDVAGRDRYISRARAWLREHPLRECAPRLRARAEMEEFDVHPSEIKRILDRPDVLATGISIGGIV
ncbi:MAG: helix-turn-helix domain-containing protein, partial [Solirubrobacteraceae bacterium]